MGAVEHLEDPFQAPSQAPRVQELSVDRLQLGGDRVLQREPVALERAGDRRERHAEQAASGALSAGTHTRHDRQPIPLQPKS